jgi:precorrin-6A/cobalt-precorrin-6A reductase
LPSLTALSAAAAAGFSEARLLAIRPPVPLDLERSLWQHWQISMVVTKASGTAGGEAIKQQLAAELNLPLILIQRPPLIFPAQTDQVAAVVAFAQALDSP